MTVRVRLPHLRLVLTRDRRQTLVVPRLLQASLLSHPLKVEQNKTRQNRHYSKEYEMGKLLGTMKDRMTKGPMLPREDSSIKKAMKSVMKLGRKNRPKMPAPMRAAEER